MTTATEHCIWSPDLMPGMEGTCTEPRVEIMVEGATHDYYCREHREILRTSYERRKAYSDAHGLGMGMMRRRHEGRLREIEATTLTEFVAGICMECGYRAVCLATGKYGSGRVCRPCWYGRGE